MGLEESRALMRTEHTFMRLDPSQKQQLHTPTPPPPFNLIHWVGVCEPVALLINLPCGSFFTLKEEGTQPPSPLMTKLAFVSLDKDMRVSSSTE